MSGLFLFYYFLEKMSVPIYRVAGQEVVDSLLLTAIASGQTMPFTISVSTGTGAKFALNTPGVLTVSLTNETETGASEVVETFIYSSVSSDDITLSARAQGGTIARTWPAGSKVQIRMSTLHLQSIQELLGDAQPAGNFLRGPNTGIPAVPAWGPLVAADIPPLSSLGGGPVAIGQGGTGLNSLTANNVILGNGTSSPLFVAPGTSGNVLTSNGSTWVSSAAPTGTAHNFLSATHPDTTASSVARGALVTGQGVSPTWSKLVLGASGTVLRSDGTDALWSKVNLTSDTTGTLSVTSGGTGINTTALGDTFYGSGTNTVAKLTGNTTSSKLFLSQTGTGSTSAAPVWAGIDAGDLPAHVHDGSDITTGEVGVAVGGTGIGSYTMGDTIYASAPFTLSKLAGNITTSRQFLISSGNGTAAQAPFYGTLLGNDIPVFGASGASHSKGGVPDPGSSAGSTRFLREDGSWVAPVGSGTVTSVDVNTTATPELTITGGAITGAGVFTYSWNSDTQNKFFGTPDGLSGVPSLRAIVNNDLPTVSVAKGGTGLTSIASGKLIYASASNTCAPLTVGSTLGISSGTLDVAADSVVEKVRISKGGVLIGTRRELNLIEGSNVTLTVTDNGGSNRMDVTIDAASGGAATHNLLSATHPDTTPASVTRGAIVTGQGGSPTWSILAIGAANRVLRSDGTDATWAQIALGTDVTGTLGTTLGGTGLSSYALGDLPYASATNTLSKLTGNTTTTKQFLSQTGTGSVSAAPAWGAITTGDLPTIPISGGGTGQTTATAAINALLPSQTSNNGKFLKTDGTNVSWAATTGSPYFQDSGGGPTTAPTVTSSTDGLAIGSAAVATTGARAIAIGNSYASGADSIAIHNGDHSGSYGAQASRSVSIGLNNLVGNTATGSVILGGESNTVSGIGHDHVIGGGSGNSVATTGGYGTVAGGFGNSIGSNGDQGAIAGGNANNITAGLGAIGGGYLNTVSGREGNIPGGEGLLAKGYAQTVLGYYNTAVPTSANTTSFSTTDPVLIVGNGASAGARSNAAYFTADGKMYLSPGTSTTLPVNDISFGGTSARTLGIERQTTAATAGGSLTLKSGTAVSGGTDLAGGDFITQTGLGTGAGTPARFVYKSPTFGSSGTTDQTLVTVAVDGATKTGLTSGSATSLVDITLPAPSTHGSSVHYTIEATDGTDFQVLRGIVNVAAVNKAGSYTTNTSIANQTSAASTGTITSAWSLQNGTNKVTLQVTPTCTGITPTTFRIKYSIYNQGTTDITIL